MTLRSWLIGKLGGDAVVGDPDGVAEIALIELWQSQLVVAALRERGIHADAVPEQSSQWTAERIRPQAMILVRNDQRTEAIEIIDKVTTGQYGPTDDA